MPSILRLTWSPRVRGSGAGIGLDSEVTDAAPTWEGYFELQVWVATVLVDTIVGIDDDRYTFSLQDLKDYSTVAGCSDAPCLPEEIVFKLRNYRIVGGQTFYSKWVHLKVRTKPNEADACSGCGNATTTTSSTTTSTSSSSSTTSTTE